MKLEHTFTVPVPVEKAWEVLLDLPTIAPCMPGATLTGVEGDEFTGTVKVKLGPIELSVKEKKTVNIPMWAGIGAIVLGGVLLLGANKK